MPGLLMALGTMVKVHTSQRTQSVCIMNTSLVLYGEINAVCCEIYKNIYIVGLRRNAKLWYVKPGGTYCYHYALKDLTTFFIRQLSNLELNNFFVPCKAGIHEPPSPGRLNFVQWHLILVGAQYGTCFVSSFGSPTILRWLLDLLKIPALVL
jgi:hypothetical protein